MRKQKKLFMNNLYTRNELSSFVKKEINEDNIMNTNNLIINELAKLSEHYSKDYEYAVVRHNLYNNLCIGKIMNGYIKEYISVNSTIEYYFKGWVNRIHELRDSVQQQIKQYNDSHWEGDPCPLCNQPLYDKHVDHVIPFNKLVEDWLVIHNLDIEKFSKLSDVDRQLLCKDFSDYHFKHAKLRYLCKHCNLSRKKRDLPNYSDLTKTG